MKLIIHSTEDASSTFKKPSVVVIGNFDGVHFGHQQILKKARGFAEKMSWNLVVLTFDPHPVKVLAPTAAPAQIQTLPQKIQCLRKCGVEKIIVQKFDLEFAKISPEDFFVKHLVQNLKAEAIFVGYDFTFGRKRSGTTETLESLGKKFGIEVQIIAAQMQKNTLVSSSLARKLLQNGNLPAANEILTRFYQMDGEVIPGFKRGTALGIHTANLKTENERLLDDGVYATFVELGNKTYASVTNIGLNPTFENTQRSIETHIFDFDLEIYKETLRLHFVEKIRDEIKFANSQALVKQIQKDIHHAKTILKSKTAPRETLP